MCLFSIRLAICQIALDFSQIVYFNNTARLHIDFVSVEIRRKYTPLGNSAPA
jgi:hypothetical protein